MSSDKSPKTVSFEGGKYKTLLLTYPAYQSEKLTNFLQRLASLLLQGASARFCSVRRNATI